MPEYEMRLRFTAADGSQASRLAEAWAGTCAAEYGTRYCGIWVVEEEPAAISSLFCCSLGHENIPADYVGVYDDGDHAEADVLYCDPCARTMRDAGAYTITASRAAANAEKHSA